MRSNRTSATPGPRPYPAGYRETAQSTPLAPKRTLAQPPFRFRSVFGPDPEVGTRQEPASLGTRERRGGSGFNKSQCAATELTPQNESFRPFHMGHRPTPFHANSPVMPGGIDEVHPNFLSVACPVALNQIPNCVRPATRPPMPNNKTGPK